MKFKHPTEIKDQYQVAYTDINVEIEVDEWVKFASRLNINKLAELKMKIDNLVSEHSDRNNIHLRNGDETINILGEGWMQVDMDCLVERIEFDKYIYEYLKDGNFILLRKPNYLSAMNAFMDGVLKLADDIKREHTEDILGGEL